MSIFPPVFPMQPLAFQLAQHPLKRRTQKDIRFLTKPKSFCDLGYAKKARKSPATHHLAKKSWKSTLSCVPCLRPCTLPTASQLPYDSPTWPTTLPLWLNRKNCARAAARHVNLLLYQHVCCFAQRVRELGKLNKD